MEVNMEVYFMHRIRHKTDGTWDKGIEVKDKGTDKEREEAAKQSYHAYLGAYAYNHDAQTDYVSCYITNLAGNRLFWERWGAVTEAIPEPEPEPTPEPEEGGEA
jgi:hypothetical protein